MKTNLPLCSPIEMDYLNSKGNTVTLLYQNVPCFETNLDDNDIKDPDWLDNFAIVLDYEKDGDEDDQGNTLPLLRIIPQKEFESRWEEVEEDPNLELTFEN